MASYYFKKTTGGNPKLKIGNAYRAMPTGNNSRVDWDGANLITVTYTATGYAPTSIQIIYGTDSVYLDNVLVTGTAEQLQDALADYFPKANSGSSGTGTGLPSGGTTGQVLTKNSSTNGDASFSNLPSVEFSDGTNSTTADFIITPITGGNNIAANPARPKAILEALTGASRLDASAIKNLPSGGAVDAASVIAIMQANGITTTPPAPTGLTTDDTANTAVWTPAVGYAAVTHETSADNGSTWSDETATGSKTGITGAISTGQFKVRVKAGTNRNAGAVVASTAAFTAGGVIPGLLSRWQFNDGSGTTAADSVGGRDLTLTNGPTWGAGSVILDGVDDYLIRPSVDFGLNGATEMSVCFQIKSTDTSGRIFSKQLADGVNTVKIVIDPGTGNLYFELNNIDGSVAISWTLNTSAGLNGSFHHVAFCYKKNALNGTDLVAYIDGSPVTTTYSVSGTYGSGFTLVETSNNLVFGARPFSFTDPTAGEFRDLRVYNKQLTSSEASSMP